MSPSTMRSRTAAVQSRTKYLSKLTSETLYWETVDQEGSSLIGKAKKLAARRLTGVRTILQLTGSAQSHLCS